MAETLKGPPCEFKHPSCPHAATWAVTDPEKGTDRFLCSGHVDLYRTGPDPWPAAEFECVDMTVVEIEDEARTVHVKPYWRRP